MRGKLVSAGEFLMSGLFMVSFFFLFSDMFYLVIIPPGKLSDSLGLCLFFFTSAVDVG